MDYFKKVARQYAYYWPAGITVTPGKERAADYRVLKMFYKHNPEKYHDYSGMFEEAKDYMYNAPSNLY